MSVKLVKDNITPVTLKIQKDLKDLTKEIFDFWITTTPIRTGNARNKTRLQGNKIRANYPYAQKLDEGYSKQAPKGMTEPTTKFIEQSLTKIMRK